MPRRSTFRFDVDGTPVASPARTETKPAALASTAVTVSDTAVAPNGTNEPTIVTLCSTPSTKETKPRSLRVSTTRTGDTGTNELADDEPDVARTTANPPVPTTDATTTPATKPRTPRKRLNSSPCYNLFYRITSHLMKARTCTYKAPDSGCYRAQSVFGGRFGCTLLQLVDHTRVSQRSGVTKIAPFSHIT